MNPIMPVAPRFGLTIVLTGPRASDVSERLPGIYHRRKVPQPVIESDQFHGEPAVRIQTPTPPEKRFKKPYTREWMGVLAAFTKAVPVKRQHKPVVAFMHALTEQTTPPDGTYVLNCPG